MLTWCLGQGADLHMAQLMPLTLTISCSSKSRLALPFWHWLARVVPDKIQEGRKMVVCVCMRVHERVYVCTDLISHALLMTDSGVSSATQSKSGHC